VGTVLVELGAGPVASPVPLVLAQDPKPPAGKGDEFGKASPIALVVILLLGLATILLIRNMTKRIKRLPASFDEPAERGRDSGGADDGSASRD
jgi:hypothetical protein